jgi:uncharacterized membrane protein YfcA
MNLVRLILTLAVGAIAGIVGGALGINASFMMLPALLLFNIIPDYKIAVGTVLLAILPPISILAVIDYYQRKSIDISIAVILCVSYFIAAKYGAGINKEYSNKILKYWSAAILFLCGFYFLWAAQND